MNAHIRIFYDAPLTPFQAKLFNDPIHATYEVRSAFKTAKLPTTPPDRVRLFARERENVAQEGFDALVHRVFPLYRLSA